MSVELATETRLEADYGIKYIEVGLTFEEGPTKEMALAHTKMRAGKMFLGRYLLYAGSPNPYPESTNANNDVIELPVNCIDPKDIVLNENDSRVKRIKYFRNGLSGLIDKLINIRMKPATIYNPKHAYMATKSLDSAIQCFEEAFCWSGAELKAIAMENPGMYPTEGAPNTQDENPAISEVSKTEEIIADRVTPKPAEEDPNRPITGADYLPGGRLYKP